MATRGRIPTIGTGDSGRIVVVVWDSYVDRMYKWKLETAWDRPVATTSKILVLEMSVVVYRTRNESMFASNGYIPLSDSQI